MILISLGADVRPGLVNDHKIARKLKMEERKERLEAEQQHKQKPVKQLEVERREEGLSVAISSENKGFAMLAKMGYKEGDAIGRSSTGIVEPIPIQVKCGRAGLGRDAAIKQLEEYRDKLRKTKAAQKSETSASSISQFRQRMAQKTSDKQLEADLGYIDIDHSENFFNFTVILFCLKNIKFSFFSCYSKCQRACEKLDLDASIETPAIAFFWPLRKKAELAETKEDPYEDKCEREPKRLRKESSSSDDDSETPKHKHFGSISSSSDSSSSESEEENAQIEEITTVTSNDDEEDDEYEVDLEMGYYCNLNRFSKKYSFF